MGVRIFFIWIIISTQWKLCRSVSVSGDISKDVTFVHEIFPVQPSMRAIIEIDVSYPESSVRKQGHNPRLGIYTTRDHVNILKQCIYVEYGQLANANLHPPIRLDESDLQSPKCLKEGLDTIHCKGNISIQDFKPRNFSFSFGFYCHEVTSNSSLKGLFYSVAIHEQTNEINCIYLPRRVRDICGQFYLHGVLPDLIGLEDVLSLLRHWNLLRLYVDIFEELCYQHFLELACYVVVPKCDPVSSQVIHPCREMCQDFRTACSKIRISQSRSSGKIPHVSFVSESLSLDTTSLYFNCDYLPFSGGDTPCFYKPVICRSPPLVQNATLLNISMNNNHSVLDTTAYSCRERFEIEGNTNIFCTYTGKWSTPPNCTYTTSSTTHPLLVVLPVLLIPLIILLALIFVRFKARLKHSERTCNPLLSRIRDFDAFVIYHFDSDHGFVVNDLVPELEEFRNFKLFIHSRDFTPGRDIKDNIEEGINNSNSAIILMSQGFVDSTWGKEEFTHCYIENMNDAAFLLFIIMMQPADTLINISHYMKTLFDTKTYLMVNDPELFLKLATHLNNARQLEDTWQS